ncbi:MAG: hypothetical protein A3G18_11505 [Rhodospirillales bacterium RIFCSPLOWO2_12_FULL_58_28]|nr:MAG: hypothetical protein A3H92_10650 [Rhodospirillales bacterium RIFCSPLOWO2_02_FULL_58_16]OHC77807.1 MAG: hypothetical protein A3G18_11505 [Rhodospirillales bacterium RIFCSPLOWO2_12_FULL_58_28]
MNKTFPIIIMAMFFAVPFAPALAVSIENYDSLTYQMIIELDGGDSMEIEVGAGQKADNVCDACYIHFGEQEPFPAEGDEVIFITDGQLSVKN